jgi:hypothetical protein
VRRSRGPRRARSVSETRVGVSHNSAELRRRPTQNSKTCSSIAMPSLRESSSSSVRRHRERTLNAVQSRTSIRPRDSPRVAWSERGSSSCRSFVRSSSQWSSHVCLRVARTREIPIPHPLEREAPPSWSTSPAPVASRDHPQSPEQLESRARRRWLVLRVELQVQPVAARLHLRARLLEARRFRLEIPVPRVGARALQQQEHPHCLGAQAWPHPR